MMIIIITKAKIFSIYQIICIFLSPNKLLLINFIIKTHLHLNMGCVSSKPPTKKNSL
jgi:hypothetical protein